MESQSHNLSPETAHCKSKSLSQYKKSQLLPHITEEYKFRITNRLLI